MLQSLVSLDNLQQLKLEQLLLSAFHKQFFFAFYTFNLKYRRPAMGICCFHWQLEATIALQFPCVH